jgi:hypothetical protein
VDQLQWGWDSLTFQLGRLTGWRLAQRRSADSLQIRLYDLSLEDLTLRRMLSHHSGLMGEGPASGWDAGIFPGIDPWWRIWLAPRS